MSRLTKAHTLSDGTTIRIRVRPTIAGTYFDEVPSWKRKTHSLYRLANSMFLVFGGDLCNITHPDYAYASDDKAGAVIAMKFFVDSAEACIKEAKDAGLPVASMYSIED